MLVYPLHLALAVMSCNRVNPTRKRLEMKTQNISRRDFLRFAGVGAFALFGSRLDAVWGSPSPQSSIQSRMNAPASQMDMEPFMPDAVVSITAAEKYVQILSGAQTRVWSYEGQLLEGTGVTVQNLPGNYLGPILRVKSGTKVHIVFINNHPEDSVI